MSLALNRLARRFQTDPSLNRRLVVVTAVDRASTTCTVLVGGVQCPGQRYYGPPPAPLSTCIAIADGSDLIVLGGSADGVTEVFTEDFTTVYCLSTAATLGILHGNTNLHFAQGSSRTPGIAPSTRGGIVGGVDLTTGTSSGNFTTLLGTATTTTGIGALWIASRVIIDDLTSMLVRVGFGDTNAVQLTTGKGVWAETDGSTWLLVSDKDGSHRQVFDTTIEPVADVPTWIEALIAPDSRAAVWIDGYGPFSLFDTDVPTVDLALAPFVGIKPTSSSARILVVDEIRCSKYGNVTTSSDDVPAVPPPPVVVPPAPPTPAFETWAISKGVGAWWPMQETSGTTAEDVVGGYDAAGTNVTPGATGPGASAPYDKAFSFSGSGSKLDAGDQSIFSAQVAGTGKASFMVLAKIAALSNYRAIFGKESAGQYEYDAFMFGNGTVKWQVPLDGGDINEISCTSSSGAVVTGTWCLLTFTIKMGSTRIYAYKNKTQIASSTSPSSPTAYGANGTAHFQIGNRADSALTAFQGLMCHGMWFPGVELSSSDVSDAVDALATDGITL